MTQFKDKFIAYIDVLGFKSLVAAAEDGSGLPLTELVELLSLLGKGTERARFEAHGPSTCPEAPYIERHLDFRVIQISDCAIVSAEVSPAGAINLVSHCWGAVIELLAKGIMCRGYIKRGRVFHTDRNVIGSGYQAAFAAESQVSAFGREADERGTPYVEVDPEIVQYVESQPDACVKMMFGRMVKSDGTATVLFPFQRLHHSFIVAGQGHRFDAAKERASNQNLRVFIGRMKERVLSFVDPSTASAVAKAKHYLSALDSQLDACDRTDEVINKLDSPAWRGERRSP
jgi:hypothetical protein